MSDHAGRCCIGACACGGIARSSLQARTGRHESGITNTRQQRRMRLFRLCRLVPGYGPPNSADRFYVNFNGGWIETTAVWTDVGSSTGIFDPTTRRPGAVVVYPDANGHEGHIGILIDAEHVVHCSKGNDTQFGNAIQITPLTVFNNNPDYAGWLVGGSPTGHSGFRTKLSEPCSKWLLFKRSD